MNERRIAMISDCRQVEDNLIDFVEGKASESLLNALAGHLKKCPECARMVEKFRAVWEAIPEGERFTPPASLWPELLDRIRTLDEPSFSGERLLNRLMNSLQITAAALLLLLSVVFGIQLGNVPEQYSLREPSGERDPEIIEKLFVTEYFQDFQDFPPGTLSDVYTSYEIQDPDEES